MTGIKHKSSDLLNFLQYGRFLWLISWTATVIMTFYPRNYLILKWADANNHNITQLTTGEEQMANQGISDWCYNEENENCQKFLHNFNVFYIQAFCFGLIFSLLNYHHIHCISSNRIGTANFFFMFLYSLSVMLFWAIHLQFNLQGKLATISVTGASTGIFMFIFLIIMSCNIEGKQAVPKGVSVQKNENLVF